MTGNIHLNKLEELLTSLGFTSKEARVYRELFTLGESPASEIINKSGLKRGITYNVLYSLQKHGLVKEVEKDQKKYFRIEHPKRLLDLVESKHSELTNLKNSLSLIVPKLVSEYRLKIGDTVVKYYEGEEEIKEIIKEINGFKDVKSYHNKLFVYDHKIAIISDDKNDAIGIVVERKDISDTLLTLLNQINSK